MSNNISNVTRAMLCDVTNLAKDEASLFLAIALRKGHAVEDGTRKHMKQDANGVTVVVKGRPAITYSFDRDALTVSIGADAVAKLADRAAADHAAYVAKLATAEQTAKNNAATKAKASKVAALEAKLAALTSPTGEVF